MSKVGAGPKVLVAAATQPANLLLLAGSWFVAFLVSWLVWGLGGSLVGLAGLGLYGARVMSLASDRAFAQRALEAGDLGASALSGAQKLKVMKAVGKLPPAFAERVARLEDLGGQVEAALGAGTGAAFDGQLKALAPGCHEALAEAVELAHAGAAAKGRGEDTSETEAKLDRILEILAAVNEDLVKMEAGPEALPGETVVHQLEDLSSEVRILKESLADLE